MRKSVSDIRRYAVQVVGRALDVLEVLRDAGRPLGLQEIAARLDAAKSSTFRLLCTLEQRGYVERLGHERRYCIGPAWLTYRRDSPFQRALLVETALPVMERLWKAFEETVNLGVLHDGEVFYLQMLESPRPFRMAAQAGSRSPLHSTAIGKAIAAFLPDKEVDAIVQTRGLPALTPRTIVAAAAWKRELSRVRARGYAEDKGETESGASCIGAPILVGQQVVGAISISGPTSRVQFLKPTASKALVEACATVSNLLAQQARLKVSDIQVDAIART